MIKDRYLLKREKDGKVIYEGDDEKEAFGNVKAGKNSLETIYYNLLAIRLLDKKKAHIVTKKMFRYFSGNLNEESTSSIHVTLSDLEKLLADIKTAV